MTVASESPNWINEALYGSSTLADGTFWTRVQLSFIAYYCNSLP